VRSPATPCPRCDYDLTGAVESWKSECPLDGRCPECGLEYRWAELLNPALTVPAWSFEHAHARLFRSWFGAAFRSARPRLFWTELRLENRIVPRRLAIFVLGLGLILHSLAVCVSFIIIQYEARHTSWFIPSGISTGGWTRVRHTPHAFDFLPGLLWPYGWPPIAVDENGDNWFERRHIIQPPGVFQGFDYEDGWLRLAALCATLTPLSLSAAPVTLRGCQVRGVHVLRTWTYSLSSVAVLAVALYALGAFIPNGMRWLSPLHNGFAWTWRLSFLVQDYLPLAFILWCVWFFVWWRRVVSDYLRLPQPRSISACTFSIGLLGGLVVATSWPDNEVIENIGAFLSHFGLR